MIRSAALTFVLCLACCHVRSQHTAYTSAGDTLEYRYTPLQPDAEEPRKRGFMQRLRDHVMNPAGEVSDDGRSDFSIVGGPSYSAETSLKFGVVGQLLYRTGRGDDMALQPSDVAISAGVSIIGFYRIALTGNTFFARDKHRMTYDAEITSQPTDFWGLGYDAALYNRMTDYTAKRCVVSVRYVYEMFANTYVGAYADFRHLEAVRLGDYAAQYLGSEGRNFNTAGVGLVLSYDSRDYTTNAYRGIYASVEHIVRPQALSNISSTLWRTTVTLDLYRRLWRDCTLAVDLYGEFHSSSTPWLLRAQVGNDWRMRGYYMGRFNGDNFLFAQVELRQRIWNRLGCVVWGGAGNVFSASDKFAWRKTLPNYGIGLRWEFRKRTNFRVDWGMGRKSNSFVLNINEAF